MIDIAIMIEGQDGLDWPHWKRIAQLAESAGYAGLYRSDHFTNGRPPDKDSLELWVSLAWLASHTQRLEFGPLVSPVSFRHPAITARTAAAIDDLSGGRLTLGIGAGWNAREHTNFGFDLLDTDERFVRFEEGLEVVTRLLRSDSPASFDGRYFQLRDAVMLPRPQRPGGPKLLVGGNGVRRTLPLVAKYASEWNCVNLNPAAFAERSARLDQLLAERGRQPSEVKRSMMIGIKFGRDDAEVQRKLGDRDLAAYRARGAIAGTASAVVDHVSELERVGVQRVMLQWLEIDDLAGIEAMAATVLPQISRRR